VPGNVQLKQEMGKWLGTLTRWDVFSTWTFSYPITENGAMYWSRRHLGWLEEMAGQPIYAFYAVDRGTCGGLLHVHALVGNVGHLKKYCGHPLPPATWGRYSCCMLHAWPCGYARVYPYDPKLGAAHYVANYITKKLSEWELYGFPAHPQNYLDSPMNS